MAGLIEAGTYKLVSQDGLTEKDITIDNSGNPLFDSIQLAKQNDVGVANSGLVKTALNAAGDAPIYACRAWVNFNGTGTVAIRASGNVSSITDNGTGKYTVNFLTAIEDSNYALSISGSITGTAFFGFISGDYALQTSSSVQVVTRNLSADADPILVEVAIFR